MPTYPLGEHRKKSKSTAYHKHAGRPFGKKLREDFLQLCEAGVSISDACNVCGVNPPQFYRTLAEHPEFAEAVQELRNKSHWKIELVKDSMHDRATGKCRRLVRRRKIDPVTHHQLSWIPNPETGEMEIGPDPGDQYEPVFVLMIDEAIPPCPKAAITWAQLEGHLDPNSVNVTTIVGSAPNEIKGDLFSKINQLKAGPPTIAPNAISLPSPPSERDRT